MAPPSRFLARVSCQRLPALFSSSTSRHHVAASHRRSIATTSPLRNSWMNKIKGVFTGNKESPSPSQPQASAESFTLLRFADEMKNARRLGKFKQYIVGRSSEAAFADPIEKQEAIIRVFGGFDASGDVVRSKKRRSFATARLPTLRTNALAKFTWAKQAYKKVEKWKTNAQEPRRETDGIDTIRSGQVEFGKKRTDQPECVVFLWLWEEIQTIKAVPAYGKQPYVRRGRDSL